MIRGRIFTFAAVVSLLLCAATVMVWMLSYGLDEVAFVRRRKVGRAISDMNRQQLALSEAHMPPAFRRADTTVYWSDSDYEIHVCWGRVAFGTFTDFCFPRLLDHKPPIHWVDKGWPRVGFHASPSPPLIWGSNPGISYQNSVSRAVTHTYGRSFPIWPLAICTAILPVLWIRAQMRRRQSHQCFDCGYNLTGNTSGVCPEFGTAVARKAEAIA